MQGAQYVLKVNALLGRVRKIVMGLDTPLERFLPPCLMKSTAQEQAQYLADRIQFFAVCADSDLDSETLYSFRCWMYEIILYLKLRCMRNDQTLGNVLEIFQLRLEVRRQVFDVPEKEALFGHVSTELLPPILEEDLELVFCDMVQNVCDLQIRWERLQMLVKILTSEVVN